MTEYDEAEAYVRELVRRTGADQTPHIVRAINAIANNMVASDEALLALTERDLEKTPNCGPVTRQYIEALRNLVRAEHGLPRGRAFVLRELALALRKRARRLHEEADALEARAAVLEEGEQ